METSSFMEIAAILGLATLTGILGQKLRQPLIIMLFRPFKDATEQAADALTYAMDFLPESVDWPVSFLEEKKDAEDTDHFEIAELKVSEDSDLSGKSLAELHFRQKFGANLIGIRRGQDQITTINPAERLLGGDCLIVIGKAGNVKDLKNLSPL